MLRPIPSWRELNHSHQESWKRGPHCRIVIARRTCLLLEDQSLGQLWHWLCIYWLLSMKSKNQTCSPYRRPHGAHTCAQVSRSDQLGEGMLIAWLTGLLKPCVTLHSSSWLCYLVVIGGSEAGICGISIYRVYVRSDRVLLSWCSMDLISVLM